MKLHNEKESLTYTLTTLIDKIALADIEVRKAYQSMTSAIEQVQQVTRQLATWGAGTHAKELEIRLDYYKSDLERERQRFEAVCKSYNQKVRAFQLLMEEKVSRRILFELRIKGMVESIPWYPE